MTKEDKNKFVTIEDLGKFTEQVLLPAIKTIVEDSFKGEAFKAAFRTEFKKSYAEESGKLKHELKDYIDEKLSNTKGDIIYYIKNGKERERDKNWKDRATEIFENNKLAEPQELQELRGLAV